MHKDVIRTIAEVDLFPVISILIFFAFFVGLLVYVFRLSKKEVKDLAAIPLQEFDPIQPRTTSPSKS